MGLDWIGFGYAALVASGGIIGYAKAGKSIGVSLIIEFLKWKVVK